MAPSKTKKVPSKGTKHGVSATKSQKSVSQESQPAGSDSSLPIELQQLLLNIFKNSFSELLESNLDPLLQEVKGHLYNRDFGAAFGRNDYLEAYAARWSPSRALGYAQVLDDLKLHILPTVTRNIEQEDQQHTRVVCLGGGAGAEIVAFAGFLHLLLKQYSTANKSDSGFDLIAIDIADWSQVVAKLEQGTTTPPTLSQYASAATKASNAAFVAPDKFKVNFHQHDILNTDFAPLSPLFGDSVLVTLMFTLNELYTTSVPATQSFLLNLTATLPEGALLLVVDSPGSYSTVSLNGTEKKYPMQWLLDHTLLRSADGKAPPAWMKIEEQDSKWFRLNRSLRYPIDLENMRYQLHLYKRGA